MGREEVNKMIIIAGLVIGIYVLLAVWIFIYRISQRRGEMKANDHGFISRPYSIRYGRDKSQLQRTNSRMVMTVRHPA